MWPQTARSASSAAPPAIHRNRAEIRGVFRREMPGVDPYLSSRPRQLALAARRHLRERFLRAKVAISGANFAVADSGTPLGPVAAAHRRGGQRVAALPRPPQETFRRWWARERGPS